MITLDQAKTLRYGDLVHTEGCTLHRGPRGAIFKRIVRLRVNGKLKLWKREPGRFRLPLKYGLRNYYMMDEWNNKDFHVEDECPVLREERRINENKRLS